MESDRSSSSPEDEVEVLPDRFDDEGRLLNGRRRSGGGSGGGDGQWTQRKGDFEYRSPKPGGTQVKGTWGVAGTDPEQVERMVRDVSGLLAGAGEGRGGMGGWLGLAGRLLGGALAGAGAGAEDERGESSSRGRDGGSDERRVIGYGGRDSEVSRDARGKGRRGKGDEYDDDDDDLPDEDDGGMRRRRRRRRRDVD